MSLTTGRSTAVGSKRRWKASGPSRGKKRPFGGITSGTAAVDITFTDIDDLVSFFDGTNTAFPKAIGKHLDGPHKAIRDLLSDPDTRYIDLDGTEHRGSTNRAPTMRVEDVSGSRDLKHLPIDVATTDHAGPLHHGVSR